ncbi:hypothetical protein B0H12DRAFT_1101144 [Mycena haematopus]|nr:hypothetical protein B0H12DRAFT_1101144 [Mycena haematopus]
MRQPAPTSKLQVRGTSQRKMDGEDPGSHEGENVESDEREEERTWRDAKSLSYAVNHVTLHAVGNAVLHQCSSSQGELELPFMATVRGKLKLGSSQLRLAAALH